MQSEKSFERRAKNRIEKMGGLLLKWVSPGTRGIPDRIAVLNGYLVPAEFKKPSGGIYSPIQLVRIKEFKKRGVKIWPVDSEENYKKFIEYLEFIS